MANVATLHVLLSARDQMSGSVKKADDRLQNITKTAKRLAIPMAAAGAAIVGVGALAVRSSQEQQIGINRLDQALRNVGTSYMAEKAAIEAVIEAQQRKTNFGDEAQRKALVLLTGVIGSHEKALQVLPTVLDAAAFSGKDLNSVLQTMPRFFSGVTNTSIAAGVSVGKLATFEERLAAVQEKVNGAAAAAADPLTQMKNRMGDVVQVLGDLLLPFVNKAAVAIERVSRKVIEWTAAHPKLTKFLVIAVAAVGGLMLVLGPLLIALPAIIAGFAALGTVIAIATGPIGLITLAVAGVVAGIILLRKNWDTIWPIMSKVIETFVNGNIRALNALTKIYREAFSFILKAVQKVADFFSQDFAAKIQVAIDALERGIPTINIAAERVGKLGDKTVGASAAIGSSIKTAASDVSVAASSISQSFMGIADDAAKASIGVGTSSRIMVSVANERAARLRRVEEKLAADVKAIDDKRAEFDETGKLRLQHIQDMLRANEEHDAFALEQLLKRYRKERDLTAARNADRVSLEDAVAASVLDIQTRMAADNLRVADEHARAVKAMQESISASWERVRNDLDPVLSKLRTFGIDASDIIKMWADTIGVKSQEIIDHLAANGVAADDLKKIWQLFADATGKSFEQAGAAVERYASRAITASRQAFQATGQRFFRQGPGGEIFASDPSVVPQGVKATVSPAFVAQRAHGGFLGAGMPALVGERGPELFMPRTSGTIIPNNRMGGPGAVHLNLTVNGDIIGIDDLYSTVHRIVLDGLTAGGFPQLARS